MIRGRVVAALVGLVFFSPVKGEVVLFDSSGVGLLPFDWSGHGGVYHQFGFPGWGVDIPKGPLFIDGNFAHWPQRYAFPFRDRSFMSPNGQKSESSLWYRRGDYLLDEFAFRIDFLDQDSLISTHFHALKRNFEDQYGLLGPATLPGGTIQQNYHIVMNIPGSHNNSWQIASAYYKTTDAIPVQTDQGWGKGARRGDRILANGLRYARSVNKIEYQLDFAGFSQRLRFRNLADGPSWQVDLVAYKARVTSQYSLNGHSQLFFRGVTKYSAMSSDSLGNQSRVSLTGMGGFRTQFNRFETRIGLGGGYVSSDRGLIIFDGRIKYSVGQLHVFAGVNQTLFSLPYQFSGNKVNWHSGDNPSLIADSSAISQKRDLGRLGISFERGRSKGHLVFFISHASPHYYFERQRSWEFGKPDEITLAKKIRSTARGIAWKGEINYFRSWLLGFSGISLLENSPGWGTGVQHQGSIVFTFRESLFRKRLDGRMKIWSDFWIGRNRSVWDPLMNLEYYDYNDVYTQDAAGVVNIEFKGVISSLELSYTMMNVLYAGRDLLRKVTGSSLSDEQMTLTPTPFSPPLGRLAFLTVKWYFRD